MGQFFSRGAEQSLPEFFLTVPEKLLCYRAKLLCPTHVPHIINIGKSPWFRALYLAIELDVNELRFFRLINTKLYIFFHFWLLALPEKFSFCPKNNGFARVRGAAAPSAPWLVRLWLSLLSFTRCYNNRFLTDKMATVDVKLSCKAD